MKIEKRPLKIMRVYQSNVAILKEEDMKNIVPQPPVLFPWLNLLSDNISEPRAVSLRYFLARHGNSLDDNIVNAKFDLFLL